MTEQTGPLREPDSSGDSVARTDVVVIGGGIAGLTTARDLGARGYRVTLLEASEAVGGVVQGHEIAGLQLDRGAESFAVRGGGVAALLHDLELDDAIVRPERRPAWLQLKERAVPLPKGGLLGIPTTPLAKDVIAVLGWGGAFRAYADRLIPIVKLGRETSLGDLVRRRMGQRTLDRLVSPVAGGVYSASAHDLDVDAISPGLNPALTRAGSLSGAAAQVRASSDQAGSAVQGLHGGMHRLTAALRRELERFLVELRLQERATGIAAEEEGWRVETVAADGTKTRMHARSLVIATPGEQARDLLAQLPETASALGEQWGESPTIELVTLVVDAPALDAFPRGAGMLVAEDAGRKAKALTHATAKWEWLREAAAGRHVVRVSFGRAGAPPATATLSDDEAIALAKSEAEIMLGVPLGTVIGAKRVRYEQAQPAAQLGIAAQRARLLDAITPIETLEVVGAWVSGTGLASVIPQARAAAKRIRREHFAVPGQGWVDEMLQAGEPENPAATGEATGGEASPAPQMFKESDHEQGDKQ
ncbi:protoporphyrinogen oxidase [Humidisolicoccus flavus]|uniref:protoporphyrinogen oxidase n=1 Tax=Humidisolicoccus flavus TaxID=3111414 RepID=UPI00324695F2